MLSHRYGGRFLPTEIAKGEMEAILKALESGGSEMSKGKHMVEKWYKLDHNAVPAEYSLQPVVDYDETEKYLEGQDYKVIAIYNSQSSFKDFSNFLSIYTFCF